MELKLIAGYPGSQSKYQVWYLNGKLLCKNYLIFLNIAGRSIFLMEFWKKKKNLKTYHIYNWCFTFLLYSISDQKRQYFWFWIEILLYSLTYPCNKYSLCSIYAFLMSFYLISTWRCCNYFLTVTQTQCSVVPNTLKIFVNWFSEQRNTFGLY